MRSIEGAPAAPVACCCFLVALFVIVLRGGDSFARARARRHDAHAHEEVLARKDLHEV